MALALPVLNTVLPQQFIADGDAEQPIVSRRNVFRTPGVEGAAEARGVAERAERGWVEARPASRTETSSINERASRQRPERLSRLTCAGSYLNG
jgi:hypothetical protein